MNAHYVNCDATQIEDSTGNDSDSSAEFDSHATENCNLIRNTNANATDLIYRRISNYMGDPRIFSDFTDFRIFSSHKNQRQNKYLKRFLYLFGFASTLLVLSQLLLTNYFNGSLFESKFTI